MTTTEMLKAEIAINLSWGFSVRDAFASRMNIHYHGRGRAAKRRAAAMVHEMVMSGNYRPGFDRLNRYSL